MNFFFSIYFLSGFDISDLFKFQFWVTSEIRFVFLCHYFGLWLKHNLHTPDVSG